MRTTQNATLCKPIPRALSTIHLNFQVAVFKTPVRFPLKTPFPFARIIMTLTITFTHHLPHTTTDSHSAPYPKRPTPIQGSPLHDFPHARSPQADPSNTHHPVFAPTKNDISSQPHSCAATCSDIYRHIPLIHDQFPQYL